MGLFYDSPNPKRSKWSVFVETPEWYLVKWPEGRPGLVFGILPRCDCVNIVAIMGKFASFRVLGEVVVVQFMACGARH